MVMRMIEGAVKNAADAHPHWEFDPRFRKSIAKRAAGILTAQWPSVLAVQSPPANGEPPAHGGSSPNGDTADSGRNRGAGDSASRRSPLLDLHFAIGRLALQARHGGDTVREAALVDALRLIGDKLKKRGNKGRVRSSTG